MARTAPATLREPTTSAHSGAPHIPDRQADSACRRTPALAAASVGALHRIGLQGGAGADPGRAVSPGSRPSHPDAWPCRTASDVGRQGSAGRRPNWPGSFGLSLPDGRDRSQPWIRHVAPDRLRHVGDGLATIVPRSELRFKQGPARVDEAGRCGPTTARLEGRRRVRPRRSVVGSLAGRAEHRSRPRPCSRHR